jgi:GPH family glycoside/pentoside/hexuronide:cation symporter
MYYIWQGDIATGSTYNALAQNILQVLGYLMLFVISTFLAKMEKKVLLSMALGFAMIGSIARWFTYSQEIPQLVFLDPFFFAPAYTTFWAIFLSMLSDYCDYDEYKNGKRREGVFNAISGWMTKAGATVALIVAGVVLQKTGFNAELEGAQTQSTLTNMRLALVFLPVTCLGFALLLSTTYPLSKERMQSIREELESRRGTV